MASIGSLVVDLIARTARFNTDLAKAQGALSSFDARANRTLRGFNRTMDGGIKSIGAFARSMLGLNGAIAAGGFATAAGLAVQQAAKFGATLDDVSQAAGISAEALQEYRYAASLTGTEQENMDKALLRFNRSLGLAKTGNRELAKSFNQLGVSINDTNEQALEKAFAALGDIEDVSIRAAMATKLFGKDAASLTILAGEGADGIAKLREEAHELGVVLSNDAVAAAAELDDRLTVLSQVLKVQMSQAILQNVDLVGQAVKALGEWVVALGNLSQDFNVFFQNVGGLGEQSLRRLRGQLVGELAEIEDKLGDRGALGRIAGAFEEAFESFGEGRVDADFGIDVIFDPKKRIDELKTKIEEIDARLAAPKTLEINTTGTPTPDDESFDVGGSSAGRATRDPVASTLARIQEQIAANELLAANVNATAGAIEALQARQDVLNAAKERGVELTQAETAELDALTTALGASVNARDDAREATQQMNAAIAEGIALTESLRTPLEVYTDAIKRYKELLDQGRISQETFNRAVANARNSFEYASEGARRFSDDLADGLAQSIVRARSLNDLLLGIVDTINNAIQQEFIAPAISDFLGGAFDGIGIRGRGEEPLASDPLTAASGALGFGAPVPVTIVASPFNAEGGIGGIGSLLTGSGEESPAAAATEALAGAADVATQNVGQMAGQALSSATATATDVVATTTSATTKGKEVGVLIAVQAALQQLTTQAFAAAAALSSMAASAGGGGVGGIASTIAKIGIPGLGFNTGGSFTVGGAAGHDANTVVLSLTKGETVEVLTRAQQMREGAAITNETIKADSSPAAIFNNAAQLNGKPALFAGAFASGGSFTVGGAAGHDANTVVLDLTKGETVEVLTRAQQIREGRAPAAETIGAAENAPANVISLAEKRNERLLYAGAFNTGGSFTVGGSAGHDANTVAMDLTKGETVNVMTRAQQIEAANENGRGQNVINMGGITINATDGPSVIASKKQIAIEMAKMLREAGRNL